ncbi:sushi domain-containing protein 2-like [Amphiura filiformis]|uniref:sushi domain-containing protein 2-like n=1 Tax=Amphiura filiformis TaxID=82378 RepID=UPI003B217236
MDKIIGLCRICCLLFSLPAFTTQANVLYPYGAEVGDIALPEEDDGGTSIDIDIDFPFFDHNHRSLFINTNGIISFLQNVVQYTPEVFPLGNNRRVIAPYWADVDTTEDGGGDIWYRQINNVTKLQEVTDEIMRVFAVDFAFRPFIAEWALIVTWSNVTYYDAHGNVFNDQPENTFQAVLVTDGVHSFTIFNYGTLEWTTGASSGGDTHTGLATDENAIAAQVGFNAGDNKNYYTVPNSRTNEILNIAKTTNVGRPGTEGRWVFRIDNKEIVAAGCEDDTNSVLQIHPEQVSMLGGDVLTISGPCFELGSNVHCRIDGHDIQAVYDFMRDPFTVRCPVPILMRLGSIPVELSEDGGVTFSATGYIVAVGPERQPPRVVVHDISTDVLEVNLIPNNFPDQTSVPESTRVDVFIYSYKEDKVTAEIVLKPEMVIRRNLRLSQTNVLVNKSPLTSVDVGIYRVVETGKVDETKEERWKNGQRISRSNTQPIAAMWSLPFNANPASHMDTQEWCEEWAEQESILNIVADNVRPCPCTLQQAMADVGQFERDPWCNIDRRGEKDNCAYRKTPGSAAKHCVRARKPSNLGRGQLCCYGNDNNLLILKDVPEGGFAQRNHHGGFTPVVHPGTVPFLSNFYNDRVPWEQCCPRANDKKSCDLFRERRPSNDCKMYKPPKAGTIFGDPHFISFDGSAYTFNGFGEFHIVKVDTPEIVLQARMAETMKDVKATGVIAMTMQSGDSDVIQVELNERRVIDTWHGVTRGNIKTWRRIAFYQFPYWDVEGVTIEQLESGSEITVLVTFDTGVAITVSVPTNANAMSVIVLMPPDLKGKSTGLLGTWNDDKTDDIQTPARSIIDREDPYVLHNSYGLTWAVSATDTLFRYDIDINHTIVNQLDYIPTLFLGSTVPETTLQRVCGDSWACRYDYHKTNNETNARSTKDAEDDFDDTDRGTNPVSTCGYLTPPENGNKDGIVYINGSSVTLTCNNGFRLTGAGNRRCVSGAWSGNVTVCEKVEDVDILLIIIIAAVIGGVLVLFLCFLCLICLCRKRKKNIKKDHEMGSLTHPVHTSNGNVVHSGDQDSEAGSYDRPLPMTPEEEATMADELYANGRVMKAQRISNGHAGGHHGVKGHHAGHNGVNVDRDSAPSGPPPRPSSVLVLPVAAAGTSASTSHHNGYPGSSANAHDHHNSHHQTSHDDHHNHRDNHRDSSQPTTSRHSHLPPGAVHMFPMEGKDDVRTAQLHNGHDHHRDRHHDHSRPTTSRDSHLPHGAVHSFPVEDKDNVKTAHLVGPPPKKGPKTKAKENDYDDPLAVRRGKTRMPTDHRGRELSAYSENPSDSESEDEIARIKAQMHRDAYS